MLRQRWCLGDQIGSGGFAQVVECSGEGEEQRVAKLVRKAPGASRELLFEKLSGHPNIVPIVDSGEWQDFYVIVMPRAEMSLRQYLGRCGGRIPYEEAVAILTDVATALASLEPEVVHRDIKPENVLLYDGRWCLADFGIARYAEATTAPDTHKYSMTFAYAAPEQWRGDRATNATDVYAFGVMAFELVTGQKPFLGPSESDYRNQHLCAPSPLVRCPASLASLIAECLYKPREARPTPTNILTRLQSAVKPQSAAAAKLQAANKNVVEQESQRAAEQSAKQVEGERRAALLETAKASLAQIISDLKEEILVAAPAATAVAGPLMGLRLGDGSLIVDRVQPAPAACLAGRGFEAAFDVVAYSAIAVHRPVDQSGYQGRSHSLWYCDAQDEGVYRWYELAFMACFSREEFVVEPFQLVPTDKLAATALAPITDVRQVAWQPLPIDQGNERQFFDRWINWFAQAADRTLSHPSHMPENSGGSYRRPQRRK